MSNNGGGIILWTQGFGMSHNTYIDHIGKENSHFTAHHNVLHINTLSTFNVYHSTPSSEEADFRGRISVPDYGESDVEGLIYVRGGEHLPAKIKVIRFHTFDALIEVANRKFSDQEATIRVNPYYDFRCRIKVLRFSDILGTMTVRSYEDMRGQVSVPPGNQMSGFVDLVPIPRMNLELEPIKDAFFRNGVRSLNYGTESTMVTGSISDSPYTFDRHEVFRSILQFNLERLPETAIVEKAILRLTPSSALSNQQLEVTDSLGDWQETIVAWINQPAMGSYSKVVQTNQGQLSSIEINILELVKDWVENGKENSGLFLKALDETQLGLAAFFTREAPISSNRPKLEIVYYDPAMVISPGAADLRSRISINAHRSEDLKSSLEIISRLGEQFLPATMYVSNPNFREGRITINRRKLHAILYARQFADKGIYGRIIVKSARLAEELNAAITINKRFIVGRIHIRHYGHHHQDSTIRISNNKEHDEIFKVTINQLLVRGILTVKERSLLDSSIIIPNDREELTDFKVTVIRKHLVSWITIKANDSLESSIIIPNEMDDTLPGQVIVNNDILKSRIKVLRFEDLTSRVIVGQYYDQSFNSRISVHRKILVSRISITKHDYIEGQMIVSRTEEDQLPALIFIRGRSEFTGKIDVEPADYLQAVIRTISPYLPSRIAIPGRDALNINSNITVNVKMINELDTNLIVKNPRDLYCMIEIIGRERQSAYAFIM
ncbi:DNRLRE domain-containing protein [Bacillus horti]|uniref:Carbohydrate-binding module family 96 domain-containing protein n=1 Tax=Caldalkalibacillus horti TaxID=77523 RepID=A0ABT9VVY6_9BACI|nr:DNRLRE domain-containing protein [Bacillus horti]MDQ0165159.1 hypothetical protein [Bacillus horti]